MVYINRQLSRLAGREPLKTQGAGLGGKGASSTQSIEMENAAFMFYRVLSFSDERVTEGTG